MAEEKGLGKKLLGLFVESKDGTPEEGTPAVEVSDAEKTPAELVAELAGQSRSEEGRPALPRWAMRRSPPPGRWPPCPAPPAR